MFQNPSTVPSRFTLPQLQIVLVGMLGGFGMFLAIAIFLANSGAASQAEEYLTFLVQAAIGLALGASVIQVIFVPRGLAAARRKVLQQPAPLLAQADTDLTKLRLYLRLCRDLELIKFNQYEHGQRMVDEIGRLMGGWRKKVEQSVQTTGRR